MANARSRGDDSQYARASERPASDTPPWRTVLFGGGALVGLLVAAFVALGQWQWHKAEDKEARQAMAELRSSGPFVRLDPTAPADTLAYRRVTVVGTYDPRYQVLIDNRIHAGHAGYHVVTPLRLDGSELRVLVNRGWIPATADRRLPDVATPAGTVELQAIATPPSSRFLTLAPEPTAAGWQPLWQNLDLARYQREAPFPVHPLVLQLDPQSAGSGFVRDWPRLDAGSARHRAYAWQWFAFAATAVGIWLHFLIRCRNRRP
jgi:surfeit locus 1 family protein